MQNHGRPNNQGISLGLAQHVTRHREQRENRAIGTHQNGGGDQPVDQHDQGGKRAQLGDALCVVCADALGQHDRGGTGHHRQQNDHNVHQLVAVADGGDGALRIAADHHLVDVANQQLQ
ncbi:hypothetical protein SDC9_164675 [bioreactor metagenome]|uniref:Uncharacterized protein n=1 Tax=bioreactor metagenome TaxID=1076179 RepID=A0A645FUK0_9ZZZZ